MVFCNNKLKKEPKTIDTGHNPYFNRWFSAIKMFECKNFKIASHNPYFNRWFSAITWK